tara:strand:- start:98 stop:643 length:546 start_codon:yes stop_codon:yes gene_type:complete
MYTSESGFPETTKFSGWFYSLLAGICGSVGALGIILSFTFGGKPVFVMPLVFGGAPIINTIISVLEMEQIGDVNPLFFASLTIVIIGAIVTLVTAPKPSKKPKVEEDEKPLWDQVREDDAATTEATTASDSIEPTDSDEPAETGLSTSPAEGKEEAEETEEVTESESSGESAEEESDEGDD